MTAPTATPRSTPTGIPLGDGFSTKITLALNPTICFWEKTVQPPGIDGGDAVNTTTMHNTVWRTMHPRALKTLTDITTTAAYDPQIYTAALAACNVPTTITITFPDGSTLAFYGYLKSITPKANEEGTPPEADIVISPTNWDPTAHEEAGPTLTSVAGT